MVYSIIGKTLRYISITAFLLLGIAATALGQENRNSADPHVEKPDNDFKIKVDVEEVLLDAVVVDGKGRQITDLTADDFEIFQDKKRQKVTGYQYISTDQSKSGLRETSSSVSGEIPVAPAPSLKRNAVERTIIFLINDFGMAFESTYYTRLSLRKFVEEQMMPGDLVSIIKTSRGNATLQAFTSNKQELLSRVETIQWSTYNNLPVIPRLVGLRMEHNSQLLAINYCIKALQDMPGRKVLMLITGMTSGPSYFNPTYDRIADAALRAGVVIHTLKLGSYTLSIKNGNLRISPPRSHRAGMASLSSQFDNLEDRSKYGEYESSVGADLPLSQKTGGLFLTNNWFINGIGDVQEEINGYYLLSYIPPDKTFSKSGKEKYHSIKIKVKRKGAHVHTRDGFLGNPTTLEAPAVAPPPLVEAMFSPFQYNDLDVDLASGYIDNLSEGYLLPTWMHLDGRNLQVVKEEDGRYSVSFEAGASITDSDGLFQDYGNKSIEFRVNEAGIKKLRDNGINFTVSIPVKEPGGYYVRAAVRDQISDAKGSAYQFIEIPDLKKNQLALSSLYIINGEEDASWLRSMTSNASPQPANALSRISFRSPARKDFLPGDSFQYMTVIYNAKTKKENPPDLDAQVILYRDGVELYKDEAEAVGLDDISDFKRIPIRKKLHLEDSMQPGDYVLQFVVKDNQAKEKESLTAQTLSFRITASP